MKRSMNTRCRPPPTPPEPGSVSQSVKRRPRSTFQDNLYSWLALAGECAFNNANGRASKPIKPGWSGGRAGGSLTPSPKAAAASEVARLKRSSRSERWRTTRIPRPPPPIAAWGPHVHRTSPRQRAPRFAVVALAAVVVLAAKCGRLFLASRYLWRSL